MEPDFFTLAAHAGAPGEHGEFSAAPIFLATTQASSGDPAAQPYSYGRLNNPTWEALERALGALERAQVLCFASGQAASLALMLALGETRPRLLLARDGYYGTRKLAGMLAARGMELILMDLGDEAQVAAQLERGPAVLWAETPSNPFLQVLDLERLASVARRYDAPLVVDNTIATAALQSPLEHGATVSLTSLTKSTSGHSDVVLGCVAVRDEQLREKLLLWRSSGGGIAGPFEVWLALRGLRTLPLRLERQSLTALALARHLAAHPRVRRVHYPGLEQATLAIARRQMPRGFGPLLSFELNTDAAGAERVVAAARCIRPATSFGGVESTWERRARWPAETAPPSLVRLSVGLEACADLAADLDQALDNP